MLNTFKQIKIFANNTKIHESSMLNLPEIPRNSYLQIPDLSTNHLVIDDLKLVLKKTKQEYLTSNSRFEFSSKMFKSFFLFQAFSRKIKKQNTLFAPKFLFLNKVFRHGVIYPCFSMRRLKGHFITTSFGFNSFLSKKYVILNKLPTKNQFLLNFRVIIKNKKKSLKKNFKLNLTTFSKRKIKV
jgi:hypothetical protein